MIRRALHEQVATHVIRLCALAFCLVIVSLARAEDAIVLSIGGLVERPLALSMKELKAMPELVAEVAEHNGVTSNYRGVSIVSLLETAGLVSARLCAVDGLRPICSYKRATVTKSSLHCPN